MTISLQPGSFSVSLLSDWFMAELLSRIVFPGYFLAHVSWQLHKKQDRPGGSKGWTPSRQVTRVRKTGDDGMDGIPHPKHSVTVYDNPFLKSPCPKPSIFCPGAWDLQSPPLLLWTWLELVSLVPIETKGCPNMGERSGDAVGWVPLTMRYFRNRFLVSRRQHSPVDAGESWY